MEVTRELSLEGGRTLLLARYTDEFGGVCVQSSQGYHPMVLGTGKMKRNKPLWVVQGTRLGKVRKP